MLFEFIDQAHFSCAMAQVSNVINVAGSGGASVAELPDPASISNLTGLSLRAYEQTRSFGAQCRQFFSVQAIWQASNNLLRLLNRIVVRYKPCVSNLEREEAVFQCYGVGGRHGVLRSVRIEDAQVYPSMISYALRPTLPMTAAGMLASYGAYCGEASITLLGPAQPPRGFQKQEQTAVLAAAMMTSGVNLEQRVSLCALWARIWANYVSTAMGMSGQLQSTWSGHIANVSYAGRLSSAASDYLEHDSELQQGRVVYVESDLETLEALSPALAMLLSDGPPLVSSFDVEPGAAANPDGLVLTPGCIGNAAWVGNPANAAPNFGLVFDSCLYRCSTQVEVRLLNTRRNLPTPAQLPLGQAALMACNAPIGGQPPGMPFVQPGGQGASLSVANLKRALTLLCTALPDAVACETGLLFAMMRASHSLDLDCGETPDLQPASEARVCTQMPSGQHGVMYMPQSSTTISTFQSYWSAAVERQKTQETVTTGLSLFVDDSGLVQFLAPSMVLGKMVATGRAQAMRYMGFHPALLMEQGLLPQGLVDIRPNIEPLLRPIAGAPAAFGELIIEAVIRLFGLELPRQLAVSFAAHNKQAPGPGLQQGLSGMGQGQTLPFWRLVQPALSVEFPEAVLTGLTEPGFSLDNAVQAAKAVDALEMLSSNVGFFRGIGRSTYGPHGPQLVARSGLGMGVAVVLASTCDLQANGASTVTLHTVEIRPDGSVKSGASEAVGPGTPIDVPVEQALFPPFNPPGVLQRFVDPSMIRMAMKTELFNSICTGPPADLIYTVRTDTLQNSNLARSVKGSSPLFYVCYTIPRSLKAAVYLPQFLETPAHFVIKRRNDTSVVETPAVKKAREENVPPSEAQKALMAPGYPVPAASVMPVIADGAAASLDKKVNKTDDSEVDGKPLEPGEVAEDANNDRP